MVKRLFDIVLSFILLVLFSPVMLLVALVVLITMGRPIIFRQERPGLRSRLFTIYKFRTMANQREPDDDCCDPDEICARYWKRQTRTGTFLRNTSLDELPELFNVLKGDMSIVGPRPLMPEYLERYTPEQARRHDVKPGITGLAQINGRRNLPFSKRLELDVFYVDNQSLWLDLKIVLLTVPSVLGAHGVVDTTADAIDDVGLISWTKFGKLRTEVNTARETEHKGADDGQ